MKHEHLEDDCVGAFLWSVIEDERAYRIDEVTSQRGAAPVLSLVEEYPVGAPIQQYDPQDRKYAGLYRAFATLNSENPDSMLAFARKYGLLYRSTITVPGNPDQLFARYNSIVFWEYEIWGMSVAVELWEKVLAGKKEKDFNWLESRLFWNNESTLVYTPTPRYPPLSSVPTTIQVKWPPPTGNPHLCERFDKRHPWYIGRYILQGIINTHLKEHTAQQLLWNRALTFDQCFKPKNLIGALWQQLAHDILGKLKRCKRCRKMYKGAPKSLYCSPNCRVKQWYEDNGRPSGKHPAPAMTKKRA